MHIGFKFNKCYRTEEYNLEQVHLNSIMRFMELIKTEVTMRIEEIALRQEISQMLNEAGVNKTTLKEMVTEVLQEEVSKACQRAVNENDVNSAIARRVDYKFGEIVREIMKDEIRKRIKKIFNSLIISVDIVNKDGQVEVSENE